MPFQSFDRDVVLRQVAAASKAHRSVAVGDVGRDGLVRYCVAQDLRIGSQRFPAPWVPLSEASARGAAAGAGWAEAPGDYFAHEHNRLAVGQFVRLLAQRGDRSCFVLDDSEDQTYLVDLVSWQDFTEQVTLPFNFVGDLLVVSQAGDLIFIVFHHERLELVAWDGRASEWLEALQTLEWPLQEPR